MQAMAQHDPRKQDGRVIVEALSAFQDMPEREQPPEQERDWASFGGVAEEPISEDAEG